MFFNFFVLLSCEHVQPVLDAGCLQSIIERILTMLQTKILEQLGIESLRPFQEAVLEQLLAGTDALCIAPTSAGKSVIFQALALQREQLVIVIEPHLALELDQVRQMHERGIAAETINSLLPPADKQQVLEQIASGQLRLLYVTPEMLQNV